MDDLVGVALCIQLLQEMDNIKVVFFRDEESGMMGAKAFNLSFFKDCRYVIEIDRKGYEDFSVKMAGVDANSKEFREDCKKFIEAWDYKEIETSVTDVYTLKLRGLDICVTNVSCGYFDPHFDTETVCITDVNRCYNLVTDIICNLKNKKYVHVYTPPVYSYNTSNKNQIPRQFMPNSTGYGNMTLDVGMKLEGEYYFLKPSAYRFIPVTENVSFLVDSAVFWHKGEREYYIPSDILKLNDDIKARRIAMYYRFLKVYDNGIKFVYSYPFDRWIKFSDAAEYDYGNGFFVYITKETNERWKKGL